MDRPRERLRSLGGERISDRELLAVLLGTGTRGRPVEMIASDVLERMGGLPALSRATPSELAGIGGIGATRALQIAAAFHLARRAIEISAGDQPVCIEDVWKRLRLRLGGLSQEVFCVIGLDARQCVIEEAEVARGTLDSVSVHPRDVFRPLIRMAAHSGIVAHNHPSGDPTPSEDDHLLTRRLQEIGDLLGIPILEHVVIARDGFRVISEYEEYADDR